MRIADLARRRSTGFDLEVDDQKKAVKLDFREGALVASAFGSDVRRLSMASFQSMNSVGSELFDKMHLPWLLIRLYYSAYYAGHALMLLLGKSCTYFSRENIENIKKIAVARGVKISFPMNSGVYRCDTGEGYTGFSISEIGGRLGALTKYFGES